MNNAEKVELVLIYGECQRLSQEGRFPDRQINQQRRRANLFDEDIELQVLAYIRANPRSSIRHVALEIGISYGDSTRRLEFIAWFNIQFHNNPLIVNHILWSDESKFTNNGIMNKQNHRYWDDTNPHWSRETNFQTAACEILREEQIKAATTTEFLRRLESCLEHYGGNFEQFIR
ncbi:unnamed protein product [Macrosiphum euphorbiae]|uniref:Transposase n=1 Tax=Macrosiphum euphorbiae TaxID=13131 RepID=A0AAV0XUK5_9HEMI|nr:unnamed protein product [Macrosiphum euphorbiae]